MKLSFNMCCKSITCDSHLNQRFIWYERGEIMAHPYFTQNLAKLDKLLQHSTRLGLCILLKDEAELPFTELKTLLDETDGNLSAHIKKLMEADYVSERKMFLNKKPRTLYRLTIRGHKALKEHEEVLRGLIN